MYKKLFLLLTVFVLTGCTGDGDVQESSSVEKESSAEATASQTGKTEETVSVQINISVDGEPLDGASVTAEAASGTTLLDVMKENYDIEEADTFITSINGQQQNEGESKYWVFEVNGEMVPVGAGDYEVEDGDTVEWDLSAM